MFSYLEKNGVRFNCRILKTSVSEGREKSFDEKVFWREKFRRRKGRAFKRTEKVKKKTKSFGGKIFSGKRNVLLKWSGKIIFGKKSLRFRMVSGCKSKIC